MMKGLCVQRGHVTASLTLHCLAAFLSSFSTLNTKISPLSSFILVVLFGFLLITPYLFIPSLLFLIRYSSHPSLYVCLCFSRFVPPFPPFSILQRGPPHLSWHHSHHAVAVPRWTEGRVWIPAIQELHVSRVCQLPLFTLS